MKTPHKCPCCDGYGIRPDPTNSFSTWITCKPCEGKGVFWLEKENTTFRVEPPLQPAPFESEPYSYPWTPRIYSEASFTKSYSSSSGEFQEDKTKVVES